MRHDKRNGLVGIVFTIACLVAVSSDGFGSIGFERSVGTASRPFVYLAFGDSTGVGIGAEHGGYVTKLFLRMKHICPRARMINLSSSGASTEDILREQLDSETLNKAHPNLITVGIGADDLIHGVKIDRFAKNYDQIIARLKQSSEVTIIVMNIPDISLAPAVPGYMRAAARGHIIRFNERIAEIAARHGAVLVDLFQRSAELSRHPEFFSPDGIHPSDAGYEFWAEVVWPVVKIAIDKDHAAGRKPRRLSSTVKERQCGESSLVSSALNNQSNEKSSGKMTEGVQKRWNEFGFWGGISFNATTLIGKTPDAKFGNIGLRYGRVLLTSKTVAFEWTIDAVPVAVLSNRRFVTLPDPRGGFIFTQQSKSVYGWGAAPVGLKFNFRRNRRVQPFAHTTGGFLYFNDAVPESNAARFNLTFDFAGGVQIVNSNHRAFTIGYKYQHISNGDRAPINPGVDVQMVYAGFSIFR